MFLMRTRALEVVTDLLKVTAEGRGRHGSGWGEITRLSWGAWGPHREGDVGGTGCQSAGGGRKSLSGSEVSGSGSHGTVSGLGKQPSPCLWPLYAQCVFMGL